jgi:thioredoxin 1
MDGKIKVLKVDVDRNQKAATAYKIQGVPTFILFKGGKIVWQQSGGVPGHTLKNIIQQHV